MANKKWADEPYEPWVESCAHSSQLPVSQITHTVTCSSSYEVPHCESPSDLSNAQAKEFVCLARLQDNIQFPEWAVLGAEKSLRGSILVQALQKCCNFSKMALQDLEETLVMLVKSDKFNPCQLNKKSFTGIMAHIFKLQLQLSSQWEDEHLHMIPVLVGKMKVMVVWQSLQARCEELTDVKAEDFDDGELALLWSKLQELVMVTNEAHYLFFAEPTPLAKESDRISVAVLEMIRRHGGDESASVSALSSVRATERAIKILEKIYKSSDMLAGAYNDGTIAAHAARAVTRAGGSNAEPMASLAVRCGQHAVWMRQWKVENLKRAGEESDSLTGAYRALFAAQSNLNYAVYVLSVLENGKCPKPACPMHYQCTTGAYCYDNY